MCCKGRSPGSAAALCVGRVSGFGFWGIGGGPSVLVCLEGRVRLLFVVGRFEPRSIAKRSAGRSLGRRRPAAPWRRLRPPQAAARGSFLILHFSFLIAALQRPQQPAAAPGRRAAPLRRRPIRSAAGFLHGINRAAIGGPQPPPGGGPQLFTVACSLRRLRPELECIICSFTEPPPKQQQKPRTSDRRAGLSSIGR